jgi:peptide/nickel transport system permease protein
LLNEALTMSLSEATAAELTVEDEAVAGRWRDTWTRVLRNRAAIAGLVLIALFVLVGIFAPLLAPYDPKAQDLSIIRPGVIPGPSADHWMGVDSLGRDVFSRVLYGARYSLLIGVVSLVFGASVGIVLGALAGGVGGWVDTAVMRVTDMMLAIPGLLFAIGVAALLGRSLTTVMIAIGVVNIPVFARLLRGSMLSQRESDYALAARSIGVRPTRIVLGHVLPNSIAPVLVQGTLALATAIIDAAGLAYLGLGANDPGIPEWGRMLAETQSYLQRGPHAAIFPGLAIVISCLGFNLLGDGLREALDPKFRR